MDIKKIKNKCTYIYLFIFLSVIIFMINKAKYGFGYSDEALYIAIPYRFINGDKIFLNEWNLSQMSGMITYPFVKLLLLLNSGTDGIFIKYRYIYILMQSVASAFFYFSLRKKTEIGAIAFSIFILLYAPANIMALSYNTIGIALMNVMIVLLCYCNKKFTNYISGVCLALAALCNPFLAVLYCYFFIDFIVQARKDRSYYKKLGYFTLGAATVFLLWLSIVFTSITPKEFLLSIKKILESDAGHTVSIKNKLISYWLEIIGAYKKTPYIVAGYIALIALSIVDWTKKHRKILTLAALLWASLHFLIYIFPNTWFEVNLNTNVLSLPLAFLGLYLFITYYKEVGHNIFWQIWLPGLLYSIVMHIASDNWIDSIAMGATVMCMATVLFLGEIATFEYTKPEQIRLKIMNIILFCTWIGIEIYVRRNGIFWDVPIENQVHYVDFGPQKGLYITEERFKEYEAMYNDIMSLDSQKKTLFFTSKSWVYLVDGFENTSYSPWIWNVDHNTIEKFKSYYEINPNKKPDVVYIDYLNTEFAVDWESYGYAIVEQTQSGGYVLEAQ